MKYNNSPTSNAVPYFVMLGSFPGQNFKSYQKELQLSLESLNKLLTIYIYRFVELSKIFIA